MDFSDKRQKLETAIITNPQFRSVSSDDHWLYVPEEIREAILIASQELSFEIIAEITKRDPESIERWLEENETVVKLKEKVIRFNSIRNPAHPHAQSIKPEVCKLAKLTTSWTAGKALDIPRSTIQRWMKKGWGDIKEIEEDPECLTPKDLELKASKKEITLEIKIDEDAEARQLEFFLERHKGKIRKKYSLAEKKLILEMIDRFGSKAVHDKFKVSYDTIARLKKRRQTNEDRKERTPLRYIPVVDLMKKYPGMGPMQIRDYIRRHFGLSMGVNSIRKVMEQHGWVPPFSKSSRVTSEISFYEAVRRNYLWHMDFKHQYINTSKAFILFIQDDQSRFITGHTVTDSENIDDILVTLEESIRIHGKPETIMSDGGSAFFSWRGSSRFSRFLEDFGIDQLISQKPCINGKLENLNGQLEKELLMTTEFASLKHFDAELAKWVGFYNFSRPHQGLGHNQVPADRFFPGAGKWYGEVKEMVSRQSLVAETMITLLSELKKAS